MVPAEHLKYLAEGALNTALLTVAATIGGGIAGMALALGRVSPSATVRRCCAGFIQLVQGTPLLVLMGLCFYGPSIMGVGSVAPLAAASVAMMIYASAYLSEIWRGCIQAVPRPQWEAAETLGLTALQRMTRVILPQALRISIPPTVGFLVQIVKNTSIASLIIGLPELSYNAKILNNATYQPFLYFGVAAVLYFAMCYPLSVWSRTLERKINAIS